jgi:hypothetical protein
MGVPASAKKEIKGVFSVAGYVKGIRHLGASHCGER